MSGGILAKLAALGMGINAKPTSEPVDLAQVMGQKMADQQANNSGGIREDGGPGPMTGDGGKVGAIKAVKEKIKARRKGHKAPKKEDKASKAVAALKGFKGKKK
jgi:hypothetical protein